MTHSFSPVGRLGQWLLPWVVVVFASAAMAYAVSGALAGDATAHHRQPDIQIAVSAERSPSVAGESCPPIGGGYGSYVDTVIIAESRRIACGHGAP